MWSTITKEKDKVTYEIPIKQESSNPIVFAICRTSQLKAVRNNNPDIKTLTKIYDMGLPSGYTVLAENNEAAECIINLKVLKMIGLLGNSLELIHITDQTSLLQTYPVTLSSTFIHPKDGKDIENAVIQAQLVISISDSVYKLKLSSKTKTSAEKERLNMNKEKIKELKQQREEERLQKKMELKKKEEEKIQNLSKDQKRKIEEKNYKKELKKKGLKFKMIKG